MHWRNATTSGSFHPLVKIFLVGSQEAWLNQKLHWKGAAKPGDFPVFPALVQWMTVWKAGWNKATWQSAVGSGEVGKVGRWPFFSTVTMCQALNKAYYGYYFTVYTQQPPKEEILLIRKLRERHLLEVTQAVQGRVKGRSYVRTSALPTVPQPSGFRSHRDIRMSQALWESSLWTLRRKTPSQEAWYLAFVWHLDICRMTSQSHFICFSWWFSEVLAAYHQWETGV